VIAIAALRDRRPDPVLPRWVGYANLWAAVGIAPASCIVFFHSGPLAWNGVLAWWLVLVDFFAWMCVMAYGLRHAIAHQEREEAAAPAPVDVPALAAEVAALGRALEASRKTLA
jgi:hypothetical protein